MIFFYLSIYADSFNLFDWLHSSNMINYINFITGILISLSILYEITSLSWYYFIFQG